MIRHRSIFFSICGFVLLTASSALAEQKTVCCIDGAPDGFVRVASTIGANSHCPSNDPQSLNLCIYVRFDNLKPGSKLKVCAESPTPVGWSEGEPFTDLYGCDAQKYNGSARNEKWIQKN